MTRKLSRASIHEATNREVGKRLVAVRRVLELTGAEMADRLEVSRGYISQLENGKALPGRKTLSAMARVFKIRPEYILLGGQPMFSEDAGAKLRTPKEKKRELLERWEAEQGKPVDKKEPSPHLPVGQLATSGSDQGGVTVLLAQQEGVPWRQAVSSDTTRLSGAPAKHPGAKRARTALIPVEHGVARPLVLSLQLGADGERLDFEMIPRLLGMAWAGTGGAAAVESRASDVDAAGEMAFGFEWLRRNLSHTTGDLATVQVQGDSMSPTLIEGETIIIDRGVREIGADGVYVFMRRGRMFVKRMQLHADDSLTLMSDNPKYKAETVHRGNVPELEIVGRMVWPRLR